MKRAVIGLLAFCYFAIACSSSAVPSDSETHFLTECAGGCGDLECICGVCTQPCETEDACASFEGPASCKTPDLGLGQLACEGDEPLPPRICDAPCQSDAGCVAFPGSPRCIAGVCRPETFVGIVPEVPDAGSSSVPIDTDAGLVGGGGMPAIEVR